MKRRDFLTKTFGAGVLASGAISFGNFSNLKAAGASNHKAAYDMVAIRGGEPEVMFDRGIQSLGGMKSFVKPNQTVIVKPNIGWDRGPELAANTNPQLIGRIVEHCVKAGAKKVYVFDYTCDNWQKCYSNSGIGKAVKDAGGTMVPANTENFYQKTSQVGGRRLKEVKEHELILESDVFINVPVLKNHGGATLTMTMKNLMGIVWDRRFWHKNDLHQCIADFATYRKPDLNILDAYRVMKKNGPKGVSVEDVTTMKAQLISTDMVSIDAAGAKLFGLDPETIGYIKLAHEMNAGNMNLDELNINRIKI